MADEIHTLSERVIDALARREKRDRGAQERPGQRDPRYLPAGWEWVKVLTATTGKVSFPKSDGTYEEAEQAVNVSEINGNTLTVGNRYPGFPTGDNTAGEAQWKLFAGAGAGDGSGSGNSLFWHVDSDTLHTAWLWGNQESAGNSSLPNQNDGVIAAVPFVSRTGTVDEIGIYNTVVGVLAGVKLRLGIYQATSGTNLYPGALILDSGELATAGNVEYIRGSVSASLTSGVLYYSVLRLDLLSTINFHGKNASGNAGWAGGLPLGLDRSDMIAGNVYTRSAYYKTVGAIAALPATFPAGASYYNTLTVEGYPAIYIRYA